MTGLLAVLALVACKQDDEVRYVQFNAPDDQVTVEVGVDEELDPVGTDLHSSTGEVVVGSAQVSPGGGPVGTEHEVLVIVDDDWQDVVDRASVRVDSGDRGVDEYDLEQDSADEGYYKLSLVSVGDEGEVRSDVFTFRLWEASDTGG